jgi:hypothetical protein
MRVPIVKEILRPGTAVTADDFAYGLGVGRNTEAWPTERRQTVTRATALFRVARTPSGSSRAAVRA